MAIKIFSDSCCDLTFDMAQKLNVTVIPLIFTIDNKDYFDNFAKSMTSKDFYKKVRSGLMPKTTLINVHRYIEAFSDALEAGDDVLYLGISSPLSGSYECSVTAVNELRVKYPERKIETIDSKSVSLGLGLMVVKVVEKLAEGTSFDELVAYARELIAHICLWFTVDDLFHLKRGGRLSGVSATMGTMLGIKPILNVNDEGKLVPVAKVKGRNKAIQYLVNRLKENKADAESIIFVCHSDCIDEAEKLVLMIKKEFLSTIYVEDIGPVIGAHSGPGTLAVVFIGNHR